MADGTGLQVGMEQVFKIDEAKILGHVDPVVHQGFVECTAGPNAALNPTKSSLCQSSRRGGNKFGEATQARSGRTSGGSRKDASWTPSGKFLITTSPGTPAKASGSPTTSAGRTCQRCFDDLPFASQRCSWNAECRRWNGPGSEPRILDIRATRRYAVILLRREGLGPLDGEPPGRIRSLGSRVVVRRESPCGAIQVKIRIPRGSTSAPSGGPLACPAEADYRVRSTTAGPNLASRWQVADIAEYRWSYVEKTHGDEATSTRKSFLDGI